MMSQFGFNARAKHIANGGDLAKNLAAIKGFYNAASLLLLAKQDGNLHFWSKFEFFHNKSLSTKTNQTKQIKNGDEITNKQK